ncbi:MAG TPA: hypothetical protein VG013_27505, partial [Gemmataceae bacterium]|nr:hypothetical protein [Gemmataceae bacterium]
MSRLRSGRMVALGIVFVWGLTPSARAGHWFGCCDKTCDTTVNLPAQRVTIEAPAPRVSVHESTRLSRSAFPAVIGTV